MLDAILGEEEREAAVKKVTDTIEPYVSKGMVESIKSSPSTGTSLKRTLMNADFVCMQEHSQSLGWLQSSLSPFVLLLRYSSHLGTNLARHLSSFTFFTSSDCLVS